MRGGGCCCPPFCTDTYNHRLHQTPHPCVEAACLGENLSSRPELPSNSGSWKESKKAEEPDREGQRGVGWQRKEITRCKQPTLKHRAAFQVLRVSASRSLVSPHPQLGAWCPSTGGISLSNHLSTLRYKSYGLAEPLQCRKNLSDLIGEEKRGNVEMQFNPILIQPVLCTILFIFQSFPFFSIRSLSVGAWQRCQVWVASLWHSASCLPQFYLK